jgi:polysaccharide pyruvyl transferase WcaK-like protein
MIIELKGIGFTNKGAELLCIAMMQECNTKYGAVQYVYDPLSNYEDRLHFPLYTKFWMNVKGLQLGWLGALIPQKFRKRFGIVLDSEVQVILEASGFAYGDKWGYNKAHERMGRYIAKWKKQGKKVILLPQAFGAFTQQNLAQEMLKILQHADVVFARDEVSLQHLQSVISSTASTPQSKVVQHSIAQKIYCSPDFTNLVQGICPENFDKQANQIAIIPNAKMLEMNDAKVGQQYIETMAQIVRYFYEQQRNPYILIHEGQADVQVAQKIVQTSGCHIEILQNPSAVALKGIISTAQLVVTSRFHGAVSALSQGVPALVWGWSHKYKMLLQDYECTHAELNPQTEDVLQKVREFSAPETLEALRPQIARCAQTEKQKVQKMWDKVHGIIQG